ncbi:MAG: substrate-binding domain-containing protein [candidate division Zixibacteria bacterium]|nr:substrate-binding domain-containing protein [candidate division Zixibacteria bacterium]
MISIRYRVTLLLVIGLAALTAAGCSWLGKGRSSGLTIVAPDYLKGVIETVAAQFEVENKTRVRVVYEPFDKVLGKAGQSGIDLFVIGDTDRPETHEALDSLRGNGNYSCPFRLSLIVAGRPDGPSCGDIRELAGDDFRRIVMVDTAQYEGLLAQEALQRTGLWKKVRGKLILARSTTQMSSYLKSGEADAVLALEVSLRDEKGWILLARLDDDRRIQRRLLHCAGVTPGASDKNAAQALLDLFDLRQCPLYRIAGVSQDTEE